MEWCLLKLSLQTTCEAFLHGYLILTSNSRESGSELLWQVTGGNCQGLRWSGSFSLTLQRLFQTRKLGNFFRRGKKKKKQTENNKRYCHCGEFGMQFQHWASFMAKPCVRKIGLSQWKQWHNLHYGIANSNATSQSLEERLLKTKKPLHFNMLGSKTKMN